MKNDVLIIYGSLNSVPSPEGAAPAKVIYETVNSLNDERFKVLSNYNPKLESFHYDKDVFLHVKPNVFDKLFLLGIKLLYPYKKRKQVFSTTSDEQLLFFLAVCRFIFFKGYQKIIVHVSVGLVNMIKLLLPSRKVVFHHHGTSLHTKYDEAQWQNLLSHTEAIFGVNKVALQKANQTFSKKLEASKYFPIPNAILAKTNLDEVKQKHQKRLEVNPAFVFAFSGRICQEKGVLNLIQAFEKAYLKNNNIQLLIFGGAGARGKVDKTTSYLQNCYDLAKQHNLPITFTGFLEEEALLSNLSEIDVLILPTDNTLSEEGMPLCLIEALSLSKPIVATNSGGNAEVVEDENNGILITSNPYINELADAMLKLSLDKDLYVKFSKAAYTSYIENYTYGKYTKTFTQILRQIGFIKDDK